MNRQEKIKVLVIDDSAIVRQTIKRLLGNHPFIEVVGSAISPEFAVKKIQELKPDVLLLDIQMPGIDGLTFLEKLMKQQPIPTIIFSAFASEGSENALKAFEYGAVEVIEKPKLALPEDLEEYKSRLEEAIEAASVAKLDKVGFSTFNKKKVIRDTDWDKVRQLSSDTFMKRYELIAIGASTGGPEAIRYIMERLDNNLPPIVIVQHMPPNFTQLFSKHLDSLSKLDIKEAEDRDVLLPGKVFIAPGDKHIIIDRMGGRLILRLDDRDPYNRHKPSVDILFFSVAAVVGANAIGVLLTGMGGDGAEGLLKMKEKGAFTIAQDEESSVIFGMPKVAIEKGAAKEVLPLNQIPYYLQSLVGEKN